MLDDLIITYSDESWIQQHKHYLDRSPHRLASLQTPQSPGTREDRTVATARKVENKMGSSRSICISVLRGKSINGSLILIDLFSVGLLSTIIYLISVCFEDTNNKRIPSLYYFDLKGSDLKKYLKPAVVVVTGDLTDAKTADYSGSEQYIEEWQTYQHIVRSVTNNSDILWLDIRGNHDNFDVPSPVHR